jgi:F5/8 type C domain
MIRHSNNFASDHPVEHLWDGCLEGTPECTAGAGNIASFWIEFDLGKLHDLSSVRLFGDANGNWWSTTWTLEYKQNLGDPWSTAFKNVSAFLNDWSTQSLHIAARYVRVTVSGNQSQRATQARELELYGTPRQEKAKTSAISAGGMLLRAAVLNLRSALL